MKDFFIDRENQIQKVADVRHDLPDFIGLTCIVTLSAQFGG